MSKCILLQPIFQQNRQKRAENIVSFRKSGKLHTVFNSRLGNVLFPGWEYFVPKVGIFSEPVGADALQQGQVIFQ